MALLNIDFSKVEAAAGFTAIPTGWQRALMTESEEKPTANNATTGNLKISTRFKIMDGPYANQVIFKDFNHKNASEQAQSIGWSEMKALNDALGIAQPQDSQEWHNKPVLIHVKLKPARRVENPAGSGNFTDYDAQNDINGFKSINDTSVEVNHNKVMTSGGSAVQVAPSFASGGSPVPVVGTPAPSGLAAAMAAAATPAPVPTSAAAPVAPVTPAAPVVPAAPAAPVTPPAPVMIDVLEMTEKAQGMTREAFIAADPAWASDELLIQHGYAVMVKKPAPVQAAPSAPSAPVAPSAPAAPTPPAQPAATPAATATAGADVPPWLAGK